MSDEEKEMAELPPMDPNTDEASEEQLAKAKAQGEAFRDALAHMIEDVAQTGGVTESGDYLIGYAIEEAEGLYSLEGGELRWSDPDEENVHIEVAVCDRADGRLIPGLDISVTVMDADGNEFGTHPHELVWHPMIYHYARNWTLPGDGTYSLRVEFPAPTFMRHDRVNGRRYEKGASVVFEGIEIETGQD